MAKKTSSDLTERFVSQVNMCRPKKVGSGMFEFVMSDDNILGDVKYVLLTGIDDFDELTGGFPFGRISEVFGLENCGKSALMLRAMCRFQAKHIYEVTSKKGFIYTLKRMDPRRVRLIKGYIDNEGSLEKGFKLAITDITYDEQGVEHVEHTALENCGLGRCDTVEQVFLSAEKFVNIIRDAKKEAEEDEDDDTIIFGAFIVDTVAGTSSKSEMEREWGEQDYPRAAGKISEGFRCLTGDFSRYNIAAIFTNQVRSSFVEKGTGGYHVKFSTPQEKDYSTYGGKALAFYATHRIFMFGVPIRYVLVKGAQFPAGFLVGFRTVKNRLRKPMREGRMVLLFDEEQGGLNNLFGTLETLCFLKVAERHDSGAISFKFRKLGIETTTFAENVVLSQKEGEVPVQAPVRTRRRKPVDPMIEDKYQWKAFFRAHRSDLQRLHDVAIERAFLTEGLDEFYKPDTEDDDEDLAPDGPAPSRRNHRSPVARLVDEETD